MAHTNLPIALLACLTLAAPLALADPPQYALHFLGDGSKVEGINGAGLVTGWRLSPSPSQSFVAGYDHPYEILPLPNGFTASLTSGINDQGVVIGTVYAPSQEMAAVWYPDGAGGYDVQTLGTLPGHNHSRGLAINNRGDLIGVSIVPGFQSGPAVWFNAPEGITNLASLGAPSDPTDINDSGLIVGFGGMMFDLDAMTGMPLPPGNTGAVYAVNAHGDLAGYKVQSQSRFAIRWTEDFGWQQIGGSVDPSAQVFAYDINDDHTTVGPMVGGDIYFDEFGLLTLHSLLAPDVANWSLGDFHSINNNGQIALTASNPNTFEGGVVLLTPLGSMIIPGDVNGDASVNLEDYCAFQKSPIDLNGDEVIDDADEQWLVERLAQFGLVVNDCNANGIGDFCDIADGFSADCDNDGTPDECQPDCNADGVPDACEPDCNANGIPDPCDIADGASKDCNNNGVPDECDAGGISDVSKSYDTPLPVIPGSNIVEEINVVDVGPIEDLNFTIDIGYRIGYLSVSLSHNGTTVTLIDRPGHPESFSGNSQLGYAPAILDDEGTGGPIEDEGNFGPPFDPIESPPSYTPNDPLSAFDGMPAQGTWSINIVTTDDFSPGDGLHSWGLTIRRAPAEFDPCCQMDLSGDGLIGSADLNAILGSFGCTGPNCLGDLDGDGATDSTDLNMLLGAFGQGCD